MTSKHFLESNFSFSKNEFHLKSQFKMLNGILVIVSIFTFLFGLMYDLGLNNIGPIHSKVDYVFSISCLLLIFLLRRSKSNYFLVANLLLVFSFLAFVSATIFVSNDEFRMIWFILLLFVSYFISGKMAGWLIAISSILVIIVLNDFIDLKLSSVAIMSAILGIVIANFLALFYTNKINEYESFMHIENKNLNILASTDNLTGIMNQRIFKEVSSQYFDIAKQHEQLLSLMIFDIDNFKDINDTYGHQAGDAILVQFVHVVQSLLRKSDIFARIGGEEFSILLFKTPLEEAYELAEKLRTLIEVIDLEYEQHIINITCSIGVVAFKQSDKDFEHFFKRADNVLFQAKENGRNQTVKGS